MTRARLMITPTQLKESLLRDLRSIGYALNEIIEIKTYPDGNAEVVCDLFDPKPNEED